METEAEIKALVGTQGKSEPLMLVPEINTLLTEWQYREWQESGLLAAQAGKRAAKRPWKGTHQEVWTYGAHRSHLGGASHLVPHREGTQLIDLATGQAVQQ